MKKKFRNCGLRKYGVKISFARVPSFMILKIKFTINKRMKWRNSERRAAANLRERVKCIDEEEDAY